tara:strand:+ start:306 stop:866 length:561 start_codon:yes stop_codon:yes gene_type:complete
MATVILRPTSTTSQTGWTADPISACADNDLATAVHQNNRTCNWTAVLADLDSSLSGATINSFTISANGAAGRAGASTCELSLIHSSDGAFAAENESWTSTQSTQTTSARTTQQDGSSALTYAYINDCSVKIDPNNQGITLAELYVTVDYTAAASGYGHEVNNVGASSIAKVKGVATASIAKVIGVD